MVSLVINTLPRRQIDKELLRKIRLELGLSQSQFANLVRGAGERLGEPNSCNKRLVQKWESGEHTVCRPNYRRALSKVTGIPETELGGLPPRGPVFTARQVVMLHRQVVQAQSVLGELQSTLEAGMERRGQ